MGYREQAAKHPHPGYAWAFRIIDRRTRKAKQVEHQVDHPVDPEQEGDIETMRARYKAVFGKKPYWGWNCEELEARIQGA